MRRYRSLGLLLLTSSLCVAQTPAPTTISSPEPGVNQQTLFMENDGAPNFRIPSVLVTKAGTVLAFCEARHNPRGPTNDSGQINIVVRRSTDGGKTFEPFQIVWADGENTCGNPCPVIDETTGQIIMLMTHNIGTDREKMIGDGTGQGTRTVWISTSDDDGKTWSKAREITESTKKKEWAWYATGPGVGIQVKHGPHAGRLIIPCDYGNKGPKAEPGNSHVIFSDDHGKTWQIGGEPTNHAYNESQVVELADGKIALNMRNLGRTNPQSTRGIAISSDGGQTFGKGEPDPTLIEPHCQGNILRYSWPDDGKGRLIFANPASTSERKLMTIRVSYDDGKTWPNQKLIYAGWGGYCCLCKLPDGEVGLLYEAGNDLRYQRIDFAKLKLDFLTDGKDSGVAN